ncbi:MAG: glycosyltransferase family 4 protein [Saprospiraceae bacterium]|nr:glycosyltransferase family 4 protein [Saprospiraceae bacterium]
MKVAKKYKIAIVANTTWNIYNFRMNILEILSKNNFDIFVIAPVDKYIFYKESFPEVTHIQLKNLDRDSTNPLKDFLLLRELISLYKKIKPDLILHYTVKSNIYGGFAAGYLKIPSIAVVTGLGYAFIHNGFIKKVTKILYRYSSRFHDKVVFENIDDKTLFVEEKLIDNKKGISVKGCGVDTHFYTPSKTKTNKNKFVFTFIGRLLYDKGVVEFVEAAKIIKSKFDNVEFWMIGEIDHSNPATVKEDDLVLWVKSRTVIYHGFKDNVKKYIAQSDCVVLPSYREAIARSITEAMSMEKVVIATETAGCREAIEHGKNGLLVPVREINSLAGAMEEIINMPEETRLKMGKEGRIKAINQFDERLIAHDIFKIIMDTLKETPEN